MMMVKHFHQGDIIYQSVNDKPFVYVLLADQRLIRCENCFNKIEDAKFMCKECRYVRYCCKKCQDESTAIHYPECYVIRTRPLRTLTRMILRILNKIQPNDNDSFSETIYNHKRTWNCLMDHYDHLVKDLDAMLMFGAIFEELELFNFHNNNNHHYKNLSIEQLIRIYGKILINSFAITDQNSGQIIGRALYLGASIFDHTCHHPDLYYQFDGLKIYFIAARDICLRITDLENFTEINDNDQDAKDIDQLHISYLDEILPVWERQRILKSNYYFDCQCQRCQTDMKRLSSLSTTAFISNELTQCLDLIEDDYFQSDYSIELIQMAVDYFDFIDKTNNSTISVDISMQTNTELISRIQHLIQYNHQQQTSNQMLLKQCKKIILITTIDKSCPSLDLIRIKDFLLCYDDDDESDLLNSNEFEQILQSYSKYYGNHKHPRILRRLWFWLGILLLKKFSTPSSTTTTTKVIENLNILLTLLYRRAKIIKSYLQSG
ncbi:histone-lysine N-methyltransferase SMYD3-like [Dermatophagoides pteronyssinus]|uniref:Histone-lysine N-methyltransferase SMYD3-like n=1 Tax=Dermatophagoides pteronyssinus TaxID=6956 RepID=A0A6P6YC30_DERPT|nr:histone-lysine N-methyltransferase SMYD3-like [Dermatophagoides pteronyssinus]